MGSFQSQLRALALPVVCSPMFIVSGPELVIAQCKAGIIGAFPALNARPKELLEPWIRQIQTELAAHQAAHPEAIVAPFAVNQIVHRSNDRLEHDLDICTRLGVPITITSLQVRPDIVQIVHAHGGIVLHDVTTLTHAEKALDRGVDGLILVCAGAGGHAGVTSPFALLSEVRAIFQGPVGLAGAISTGAQIAAARILGADFAYMGTRFIATEEAAADPDYKRMLIDSTARDIVYTSFFSGINANFLRPSVARAGLDPDNLPVRDKSTAEIAVDRPKAWKSIWSAGHGVGAIRSTPRVAELVAALRDEYRRALDRPAELALPGDDLHRSPIDMRT